MKVNDSILKELFSSSEMVSYLASQSLEQWQVENAIMRAPVSLERKRDLFLSLGKEEYTPFFVPKAQNIQRLLYETQLKQGEFLYLKCYADNGEDFVLDENKLKPFLTWDRLFGCIREYLEDEKGEEISPYWFHAEKWSPDGKGGLKNDYDFHILGTEICYADYYGSSRHLEKDYCSMNPDLNLPVPFHAGDIVTIDCRPAAPVGHVVILEVGDNWDCCCLQALGRGKDGRWKIGAVKHADFPPRRWPIFSPLYRITTFCGQLPEEERLLETVSRYIEGNEKKGAALWEAIHRFNFTEQRGWYNKGLSNRQLRKMLK